MSNSYYTGTLVRMTANFTQSGAGVSPTTVTAQVKDPSNVITVLSVVNDSVGQYHADFTPTLAGTHYYRFVGSGAVAVASESAFVVTPSSAS